MIANDTSKHKNSLNKNTRKKKKQDVRQVKPIAKVYCDEHEANASGFYEDFLKGNKDAVLLLKAANEFEKSTNPEGKNIAAFCRALYHREVGHSEEDAQKAVGHLTKSLNWFKKQQPENKVIVNKIELELLKRKVDASGNKPDAKLFLRRAKLFEELGQITESYQDMSLYYMFLLLQEKDKFSVDEIYQYADLMLEYSEKGMDEEFRFKIKGLYHQIRAGFETNPYARLAELQQAADAIENTSDLYGKEHVHTEMLMSQAMATPNRSKRNKLLEQVAANYKKTGFKTKERFVRNLLTPIPVKATEIIAQCDESIKKAKELEKTIQSLPIKKSQPAAIFYHLSYMLERTEDIQRIIMRMGITRKTLTDLQIKINNQSNTIKVKPGKPLPKKMQKLLVASEDAKKQMRQDMECLFIYGNMLLDQWSYLIGYIAGYTAPKDKKETAQGKLDLNFAGLLNLLQNKNYSGDLKDFWSIHKRDIIWLNFHLRSYRNIFVEHMRKPWQRGITMASYGDDFNFHIPSPVGYVDNKEKEALLEQAYKLAPQRLKTMPDDYWEKTNLHRALEVTLYYIDELEEQKDRDLIWSTWQKLGGSAPSYDVIGLRLIKYINTSLTTIIDFVKKHPDLIEFGYFS